MADSSTRKGWKRDIQNSRLAAVYNDTEVFDFDANDMAIAQNLTAAGTLAVTGVITATAGLGYGNGAATVTQLTNRSTGVTINALSGVITGDATSLAAEATATFTVTNSFVAIGDVPVIAVRSGPTSGATSFRVTAVAAGSFNISATNNNVAAGTADTGAPVINFVIIKTAQS